LGISIDIYEESFVKNALPSYNLSALVGADRFSFLGFDQDQQKVQFLKSYTIHSNEEVELKTFVHQVYNQDNLLNAPFQHSYVSIVNNFNTLVPERLYAEKYHSTYLEKLIPNDLNATYLVDDITELEMKTVYSLDQGLKNILDGYFPNASFFHASTFFLKGARELSKHRKGYQLYLNVLGSNFQIVLFENQDLIFSNAFDFKTSKDFIYFTMLIFDQFKLKPEVVPLYLSGQISENSEIYQMIYKYIRHIHFVQLPNFLNFGPRIKQETSHHFFDLYCSKLCV